MSDRPRPLADIASEAVQRVFLDLTGQPLATEHAAALVEAAFDAIGDATVRHLAVYDDVEASA